MSNDGPRECRRDERRRGRTGDADGDDGTADGRPDARSDGGAAHAGEAGTGDAVAGVSAGRNADTDADTDADVGLLARLRQVVVAVRRADATFVAGSLAYHSIVAVLPAAVFAFALLHEVSGRSVAGSAISVAGDVLTPVGRTFVRDAMADVSQRRGILLVSVGLVAFAAVQLFRGFDRAFAAVYGAEERGALDRVTDAVYAFLVGSLGVLAVSIAGGTLSVYANASLAHVAVPAAVFGLSLLALWPLYHGLPAVETTWLEALPGTLFAATGWAVAGAAFGLYASGDVAVGIYGVLGGLALLLLWFYVAHVLLLVGAGLNAGLAGRLDGRG